ncbi:MAG: adenylyl-sulfate kinase [Pirellulaceae bacterium]
MGTDPGTPQVVWHPQTVSREGRAERNGHRSALLWFTGLSGSGKSTIANLVEQRLHQLGRHTFLLDGDNLRHGLCSTPKLLAEENYPPSFCDRFGLGFSPEDREENVRRVGETARLLVEAGVVALTALVSPYRKDRQRIRKRMEALGGPGDFVEIFVDTPLEICIRRDPKGLYQQALAGKIPHFTGVSDPYEPPDAPEIHLDGSGNIPPQQLADQVVAFLERQVLPLPRSS